jgi:hypothetical protein
VEFNDVVKCDFFRPVPVEILFFTEGRVPAALLLMEIIRVHRKKLKNGEENFWQSSSSLDIGGRTQVGLFTNHPSTVNRNISFLVKTGVLKTRMVKGKQECLLIPSIFNKWLFSQLKLRGYI